MWSFSQCGISGNEEVGNVDIRMTTQVHLFKPILSCLKALVSARVPILVIIKSKEGAVLEAIPSPH